MTVLLATLDDLTAVLGYSPDDTQVAERHLEMASATVEGWCGRAFTRTEDDSVTVRVDRTGRLTLPSGPWVDPVVVTDRWGDTVDADSFVLIGDGLVRTCGQWPPGTYTVEGSHGYDPIPDDVAEAVCQLAALRMSGTASVYTQERIGDWSGGVSANAGTANAETGILAKLRHYKRLVGRIEVL